MKAKHEKFLNAIHCLEKNIVDVKVDQNMKAEQVIHIEDILRRPMTVAPVFELETSGGGNDYVDERILCKSRTNSSLTKKKHKNDQTAENQMLRKLTNKNKLRAPATTYITQRSKGVITHCKRLVDGSHDSDNAANDKEHLKSSLTTRQKDLCDVKDDGSDSSSDFTIGENNSGSNFGESSSEETHVTEQFTTRNTKLTSNKVSVAIYVVFMRNGKCLLSFSSTKFLKIRGRGD
jgi:hypothetical protein